MYLYHIYSLHATNRSTGVGPTEFTTSLPFAKTARGRIAVDDKLRVLVHPDQEHGPSTPGEVHPLTYRLIEAKERGGGLSKDDSY